MSKNLKKLLLISLMAVSTAWAQVYNVRDYGAKGDGKTLDSPAINAAINAAADAGGGQVLLPAGTYPSRSSQGGHPLTDSMPAMSTDCTSATSPSATSVSNTVPPSYSTMFTMPVFTVLMPPPRMIYSR